MFSLDKVNLYVRQSIGDLLRIKKNNYGEPYAYRMPGAPNLGYAYLQGEVRGIFEDTLVFSKKCLFQIRLN